MPGESLIPLSIKFYTAICMSVNSVVSYQIITCSNNRCCHQDIFGPWIFIGLKEVHGLKRPCGS